MHLHKYLRDSLTMLSTALITRIIRIDTLSQRESENEEAYSAGKCKNNAPIEEMCAYNFFFSPPHQLGCACARIYIHSLVRKITGCAEGEEEARRFFL